ncbi:ash family protein [Salmonella enterica]|nr:ash family protein [Salmonella enterica]EFP5462856.1 ash family protein [Salmonella enterica]EFR7786755.1 ash family protein [Salmonella enterica]EFS3107256.1 ash family protein [Salmonella enterica]EFY5794482.1 ash family protein [Salmonella enterica]
MTTYKKRLLQSALMGYISPAPHKTGAGNSTPLDTKAHNRASGFFTCEASSHLFRIMVGRAGPTSVGPVSFVPGSGIPVRLTTPSIPPLGGELTSSPNKGYSSWPTANHAIPTLTLSVFILIPKSIAACSVPNAWFAACILRPSATAVLWLNCACRLFSAIWLTTCGICGSSRKNPDSNPPESLKQTQHSACWWSVCLHDIQEAL